MSTRELSEAARKVYEYGEKKKAIGEKRTLKKAHSVLSYLEYKIPKIIRESDEKEKAARAARKRIQTYTDRYGYYISRHG